jgi:hypothetical protein
MRLWAPHNGVDIPRPGDRVERGSSGGVRCGTVHYADALQLLIVWDDGSMGSLRIGREAFRIVQRASGSRPQPPRND